MTLPTNRTTASTAAEHVTDHNTLHGYYNGPTANRQTDSYTLVSGDLNKVIEMNKATANNLTVPLNASVAFPVGTVIEVMQYGAGQTTIVAAGGVTLRSSGAKLKLTAQYSSASLRKIGTDEWHVAGELSA
jgi:hypothetical protein